MRKTLGLALAAASLAMAPAANAAVSTTGPDTGPDGSFTIGFSGSNVAQPTFSETFSFSTSVAGFVNAIVSTTASTPMNNIDFSDVFISTSTGTRVGTLASLTGTNTTNEVRAINDLALGVGNYTLTTQGSATGSNGSYGGSVSFRAASAVPEPATWAMMLVGFGAMGVSMRRRRSSQVLMQAA
jgi:PEP-CTERM motif